MVTVDATEPAALQPTVSPQALAYAAVVSFPGVLESARRARRYIHSALTGHQDLDTAVLLTSELVANAVEHSRSGLLGGRVTVRVLVYGDVIRVEVVDDGPLNGMPHLADVADLAETGRGLLIAQASAPWGTDKREGHTVVWFEVGQTDHDEAKPQQTIT